MSSILRKVTSFAATMGLILATIANLPRSASAANRGGLWVVVHDICVPGYQSIGVGFPCSEVVITTVLGVIALMLVRKVSPQFFLLLSGARSIHPEDMPALFGIIASLCRRAAIAQVPGLYFLPSGVPTAFATGVGDQSVIVVSSGLLRLLMTRELTGVLAHEITHIAKHDVELMQLAGIVGQMTWVIAQVAIIIAVATWLLDIFGPGEGVDGLSLGVLVAAPIAANLILGALSRLREHQADLEAVALTDDPAGLARAIELTTRTNAF
jgi:heat shock protein HtpX